jgi:hypothetical protein
MMKFFPVKQARPKIDLLILLVIIGVLFAFNQMTGDLIESELQTEHQHNTDLVQSSTNTFNEKLDHIGSHLQELADQKRNPDVIVESPEYWSQLISRIKATILRHDEYTKLRWIDPTGQERVRVTRTEGLSVENTPVNKLQNKSHRNGSLPPPLLQLTTV